MIEGRVVEVLGVYDADGGLRGEAAYVVGKVLGRRHCSLCDITHSPVRRKRDWDALVAGSAVPIRVVHRNELSPAEGAALAAEPLPVVAGRRADGSWLTLLGRDDLEGLDGSVAAFAVRLGTALDGA